uniref:Uncharacterized protein n=1 Tax=viral metagenome TaxID=1070528 RepID=A0A6C0EVD2_9ZZZZ
MDKLITDNLMTEKTGDNDKIKNDYLLLIMNCVKYRKKALVQKSDWLQRIPSYLKYYHVIGNENMEKDFLIDEEERIIWVKAKDDYNSLPSKVIAAFSAIQQTHTFKYIFKSDDSVLLQNDKFFDTIIGVITRMVPKVHYGGKIVNVEIPYMSKYYLLHPELPKDMIIQSTKYCSGSLYFLSSEAVTNLIPKRESVCKEYLEDYAVGLNLHPFFKKIMLPISTDKYFKELEEW